ncbi:NAD(P)H-hydrate dehydratase, partial [Bowmanella dokdonensis]|nr:bifunctional ADP-dependent NAD(P)H-hydrate dehydratase/NAD(P)H-hydrate epimerase [Bowmanella dokdonensis]
MLADADSLQVQLNWASCIVIGPGLGQDSWSSALLNQVLDYVTKHPKPILLDADALNLLATCRTTLPCQCILTPHPGEAARLLGCKIQDVENNRYQALSQL